MNLYIKAITCLLRFVFVSCILETKYCIKRKYKAIILIVYVLGYILLENQSPKSYFIQNMYTLFMLWIFCLKEKEERSEKNVYICLALVVYECINLLGNIVGSVLGILAENNLVKFEIVAFIFSSLLKMHGVFLTISIFKKYNKYLRATLNNRYLVYICYFFIVCIKIPFLYTDIKDGRIWKMVFLTIICCTVIFLVISRIDKHNAEKERARIEENNKILQTKLHKSKEILPAVVYALNDMAGSGKIEMEEENTHKLLAEVVDLYGLQVKEDSKEDLRLKNFCSTGLALLDRQLRLYQSEALDRNINLDIMVQAPIDVQMKQNCLDQLRLQRAVGDMVRNAFRAIEREEEKSRWRGHVLLIIGCRYEDILEIAVVDNGAAFPLQAVESFGRRGITTGGTGNGLADLVEFAEDVKASICLEEFPKTEYGFTKKLSIVFDNKKEHSFKSSIREQMDGSFWNRVEL